MTKSSSNFGFSGVFPFFSAGDHARGQQQVAQAAALVEAEDALRAALKPARMVGELGDQDRRQEDGARIAVLSNLF